MRIEARNKRTGQKKTVSLSEARELLGRYSWQAGLLELGTSVVANGWELRPIQEGTA